MNEFIASISGLGYFVAYFATALALVAVFLTVYTWVTPHGEIALIRQGNVAAALSLSGALLGFIVPLAGAFFIDLMNAFLLTLILALPFMGG